MVRPSEVRRRVLWQLVLSACGLGCVCAFGCCGLVGNRIGDEGCAALNNTIGLRQQVVYVLFFFPSFFIVFFLT